MIRFDQTICANLDAASRREWLETNGLGGFATSTIVSLNTRRYHGLLVAATQPPVGRMVLLSKLEETLTVDGHAFELSVNEYPQTIHPRGYEFQREFRLDPFPTFIYETGGLQIMKTIFMIQGENTLVVQYELVGPLTGKSAELNVCPLIAFRDFHSLTQENAKLNSNVGFEPRMAAISPYFGLPPLYLAHNAHETGADGSWFLNFQYRVERERGLEFAEDLFNPCWLKFDLTTGPATIIASTLKKDVASASNLRAAEIRRRESIAALSPAPDEITRTLTIAADQFIVARGNGKTVIAGYPWFSDWGRDTMISLAGLTLPSLRFDIARGMLRTFAHSVSQGMLPNRFPDAGEAPEYNTVDATLWFFEATRAYLAATHDSDFVRGELYNVLADIIAWHIRGTRYNIHADADGLLNAGEQGVQLTWMDAKVGDQVITPRQGKPVEIQALWYNALCIMADLAEEFEDAHGHKQYSTMATLARWSFNQAFWRDDLGCLYDVIETRTSQETIKDASIRPNQILAVSLHYTMLTKERAERLVEFVRAQLLTPMGLRTLAATDPQYHAHYIGGPAERDAAYHQGTVWPWLIGPFVSAYLRVHEQSEEALEQAAKWLEPLEAYLMNEGVGQVAEIFEGDEVANGEGGSKQRAVGCPAQAWSIAELLRARAEITSGISCSS
jgi:predicted glycogen debranching enzyme